MRMINRRDLLLRGATLVGVFGAGSLYWLPVEAQEFNPDMPDPGKLPTGVRHTELLLIPTRDGTRIAASLWLPEVEGRYPLILMRSLNRRQYSNPRRLAIIGELLEAGYAFMGADIRGRFESDGEFDPADSKGHDGRDGYDMIEWVASQSWCDGNIGTFGASHQAAYQVKTAFEKPPHLRAIATWTGGYSESGRVAGAPPPMAGGAMPLIQTLIWLPNESAGELDRLAKQGQDMDDAKRVLARMRTNPQETYLHLPLRDAPIARYGRLKELLQYRLDRNAAPVLGPGTHYEKLEYPTMHECGWYDPIAWTQCSAFTDMRKRAGSARARDGQYLVIGPWQHSTVFQQRLGEKDFGATASNAGSGINTQQIQFFDKYVRGQTPPVQLPRVRYFVMGPNVWRTAEAWPPPGMARAKFYLRSNAKANSVNGDGVLAHAKPTNENADRFTYDPENPVPTIGGAMIGALNVPGMRPGPVEQGAIESRHDVLIYSTPVFDSDTEISGPAILRLFASTSAIDTDFTAKLTLVEADGKSFNLCEGLLRLSGRNFTGKAEPAEPGKVYDITIGIGQTSIVISKGQRLRLQVSSSNFPQYDRNMNTGNAIGVDAKGVVAQQTIYHDRSRASYLELPMASAKRDA
jgi:putative CocE/NonD family hydrolase